MRKTNLKITAMFLAGLMMAGCASSSSVKESGTAAESKTQSAESSTVKESESAAESETEKAPSSTKQTYEERLAEIAAKTEKNVLNEGYSLVWEDDFSDGISEDDWNYETHEPGWVNNELQAYVDSSANIYAEDGILKIKPIKISDTYYTSGRVNTQRKHDFKYGYFEASIKMPKGKGFLPAFWMMPTDENLYGQWPRCGEIDIAEVLGNEPGTAYGTIHYGNPHSETQGKYTLEKGDYSKDFHVYGLKWEPGKLTWYIDGNEYHSADEWYTTTVGQGTVTYPAPYDQPFYIILNLAVGGNWPGNPDETTDFDSDRAQMQIDYVRVYQKAEYDENVKYPEKEVVLRNPDETGNYITNGDFAEAEDLDDSKNWNFLTAMDGKGSANIKDGELIIKTDDFGTVDYSIQLVSWKLPMEKGSSYRISFDAYADEARQLKVAVTAPERGWIRYFEDLPVDITTEKTHYEFEFNMEEATDANGRLEFNMGNQESTSTIYLSNVRVEKTAEGGDVEEKKKVILADGNHVYNGSFREGDDRVGFWEFDGDGTYEVTSLEDGRRLHIVSNGDFKLGQTELAIAGDAEYELSFEISSPDEKSVTYSINSISGAIDLSKDTKTVKDVFTCNSKDSKDILFTFPAGEYYIDNVRVVENALIKNGSFSAGFSGYEVYVDSSASAEYVVDSITEDEAADFTIKKTGENDWNIQLKANDVPLVQGKSYHLRFEAKSDMEREIRAIMQGGEDKDWAVYSGENIVKLTNEYQTFETDFTMQAPSDEHAFLSICLGAVSGTVITDQHRVCIDNISLEEID
jgi:beta-glucanase (GH16 family)